MTRAYSSSAEGVADRPNAARTTTKTSATVVRPADLVTEWLITLMSGNDSAARGGNTRVSFGRGRAGRRAGGRRAGGGPLARRRRGHAGLSEFEFVDVLLDRPAFLRRA